MNKIANYISEFDRLLNAFIKSKQNHDLNKLIQFIDSADTLFSDHSYAFKLIDRMLLVYVRYHERSKFNSSIIINIDSKRLISKILIEKWIEGAAFDILAAFKANLERGTGTPKYIKDKYPTTIDWEPIYEIFTEMTKEDRTNILERLDIEINTTVLEVILKVFKVSEERKLFNIDINPKLHNWYEKNKSIILNNWLACLKNYSDAAFAKLVYSLDLFKLYPFNLDLASLFQLLLISRNNMVNRVRYKAGTKITEHMHSYPDSVDADMYLITLFKIITYAQTELPLYKDKSEKKGIITFENTGEEQFFVDQFYPTDKPFYSNILVYSRFAFINIEFTQQYITDFLRINLFNGRHLYTKKLGSLIEYSKWAEIYSKVVQYNLKKRVGTEDLFKLKTSRIWAWQNQELLIGTVVGHNVKFEIVWFEKSVYTKGVDAIYIEYENLKGFYFEVSEGFITTSQQVAMYQKINETLQACGGLYNFTFYKVLPAVVTLGTSGLEAAAIDVFVDYATEEVLDAAGVENPYVRGFVSQLTGRLPTSKLIPNEVFDPNIGIVNRGASNSLTQNTSIEINNILLPTQQKIGAQADAVLPGNAFQNSILDDIHVATPEFRGVVNNSLTKINDVVVRGAERIRTNVSIDSVSKHPRNNKTAHKFEEPDPKIPTKKNQKQHPRIKKAGSKIKDEDIYPKSNEGKKEISHTGYAGKDKKLGGKKIEQGKSKKVHKTDGYTETAKHRGTEDRYGDKNNPPVDSAPQGSSSIKAASKARPDEIKNPRPSIQDYDQLKKYYGEKLEISKESRDDLLRRAQTKHNRKEGRSSAGELQILFKYLDDESVMKIIVIPSKKGGRTPDFYVIYKNGTIKRVEVTTLTAAPQGRFTHEPQTLESGKQTKGGLRQETLDRLPTIVDLKAALRRKGKSSSGKKSQLASEVKGIPTGGTISVIIKRRTNISDKDIKEAVKEVGPELDKEVLSIEVHLPGGEILTFIRKEEEFIPD